MSELVEQIIKLNHDQTIFKALGLTIGKLDPNETVVSLNIDERHYQHRGLVHGGVYVLLAESAASLAAACTLTDPNTSVVALEINANHLRATSAGSLHARSSCVHKGRSTLVYEVRVEDRGKNLVSLARCTLMIIKAEKPRA